MLKHIFTLMSVCLKIRRNIQFFENQIWKTWNKENPICEKKFISSQTLRRTWILRRTVIFILSICFMFFEIVIMWSVNEDTKSKCFSCAATILHGATREYTGGQVSSSDVSEPRLGSFWLGFSSSFWQKSSARLGSLPFSKSSAYKN